MKDYYVRIPMAGIVGVSVQSENEDEAKEKAMKTTDIIKHIEECDIYEKIVQGNVYYAPLNEIEVEEE